MCLYILRWLLRRPSQSSQNDRHRVRYQWKCPGSLFSFSHLHCEEWEDGFVTRCNVSTRDYITRFVKARHFDVNCSHRMHEGVILC